MTADIRTAAQREAERRWPASFVGQIAAKHDFVDGAVWAQSRVTPTREQIAEVVYAHNLDELLLGNGSEWLWFTAACACGWTSEQYEYPGDAHKIHAAHVAANISKLLAELAEGESGEQAR